MVKANCAYLCEVLDYPFRPLERITLGALNVHLNEIGSHVVNTITKADYRYGCISTRLRDCARRAHAAIEG